MTDLFLWCVVGGVFLCVAVVGWAVVHGGSKLGRDDEDWE